MPRSTQYPYYSLYEILEFSKKVGDIAGHDFAPYESVMTILDVKTRDNNRLNYLSSSSEYFGILKKLPDGLQVTELGREVLYPEEEGDYFKRKKLIQAFSSPKLYQKLIEKYENTKLPSNEILENIFKRFGVIASKVKRAVSVFIESAEYVESIGNDRYFSLLVDEDEEHDNEEKHLSDLNGTNRIEKGTQLENIKRSDIPSSDFELNFPFSNGKNAYIRFPSDCSKSDLMSFKTVLDAVFKQKIEKYDD